MTTHCDSSEALLLKREIRKEISRKLKSQSKKDILRNSEVVKRRLFELEEFKRAKNVAFYVSMPDEVSTHDMIDESIVAGKLVGVPLIRDGDLIISEINSRKKQLKKGPYGISEPKASEIKPISFSDIDLVLVPGLAFDKTGNRLGRGKGYYDRFLKRLPECTLTIGLCFDFQVLRSIPKLPHDIPVKKLIWNN